jgi:benzoate/toluate 1,2-dioxygenase alpha subunit
VRHSNGRVGKLNGEDLTKMVRESANAFQVNPRLYVDPEIFDNEIEWIFQAGWVYVGHVSQIANEGDFVSSAIGKRPIIVVRGVDGGISAFLNTCRHRGNMVCLQPSGNSDTFECFYHGWVYKNSGELVGATFPERYPTPPDSEGFGLEQVPRIEAYQGLIFGSLDPNVGSLDDHLGPAKAQIDYWAQRCPEGYAQLLAPHQYSYRGNWKFQAENAVDGYHPGFVHRSAFATYDKFLAKAGFARRPLPTTEGVTRGFDEGHAVLQGGYENGKARSGAAAGDAYDGYWRTLVELHGEEHAKEVISNRQVFVFPNLVLFDANIRVIRPVAVDQTVVSSYTFAIPGVPDKLNSVRMLDVQRSLSTTGMVNTDDLEVFHATQAALADGSGGWLTYSRGMEMEVIAPTGERVGGFTDEVPQRALYRGWVKRIAARREPASTAINLR